MHPELARLLHHACRRPDDPVAALVLADWLEEQGDEKERERARFIRIQNELAAMRPYQPALAALARQAADLRAGHEADWAGELAQWAEGWDFHRGLTTLLLRADEEALDDVTACPAFAWVSAVYCRNWKAKQVKALSEWRGLDQVGELEITGAGLNARAQQQLEQTAVSSAT